MNNLHYPSLDRCKKLTELGFPKTEIMWHKDTQENRPTLPTTEIKWGNEEFETYQICPETVCPSIMEMMDVVPKHFHDTTGEREDLTILYHKNGIDVGYAWFDVPVEERMIKGDSFPNTLADLIIWLVENSHLTFDKR